MNAAQKQQIALITKLIKQNNIQEALDEVQVFALKYPKIIQGHLLAGKCYQKLGQVKKAQLSYLEVLDNEQNNPYAIKALCDIYSNLGNNNKAIEFLQKNAILLKGKDDLKYRQSVGKLVQVYEKDENMEKIDNLFKQYVASETKIGQDFAKIASAYFKVGVKAQYFNLQNFQAMGVQTSQDGQIYYRLIDQNAKQLMNQTLMDIMFYLQSVAKQFKLSRKDISNSLFQLKFYFNNASCLLMLFLMDQFAVSNASYSHIILQQILKLLQAFYDKTQNLYSNMQYTDPQMLSVSMILSFEYLSFFSEFFTMNSLFLPYFDKLRSDQQQFFKVKIRQDYIKKINSFILKQCRITYKIAQNQNIENKLQELKTRIKQLPGSYLQEVLAKMSINCFQNYNKLNEIKNLLKLRIQNYQKPLQEDKFQMKQQGIKEDTKIKKEDPQQAIQVRHIHTYKYYFDYLIKIAKSFKVLDQQICIYRVIKLINEEDTSDIKYMVQGLWLQFSRLNSTKVAIDMESQQKQIKNKNFAVDFIKQLDQKFLPLLQGQKKSEAIRKKIVLKWFVSQQQGLQDDIKQALAIDRSAQNLQSYAVYLYQQKNYALCVEYLKEAYVLNQGKFHVNRLIYICLNKLGQTKEALQFLERIYQGFDRIFWVNYVLALKNINQRKFQKAQQLLSKAIECFRHAKAQEGKSLVAKPSFQKTFQGNNFGLLYMVHQNEYQIFLDQIIVEEKKILQDLPISSFYYLKQNHEKMQLKLWTQMGEILKTLGRTKSSFNYMTQINQMIDEKNLLSKYRQRDNNQACELLLDLCLIKKQYATILFYIQRLKQSQLILVESHQILNQILPSSKGYQQFSKKKGKLLDKILVEIKALFFQISMGELSIMMKFDSYQAITQFIGRFRIQELDLLKKNLDHRSVNFLKGQYQYYIISFLHTRKLQFADKASAAIRQYIRSFDLNLQQFENNQICFENKLFQLKQGDLKILRQTLQDLLILDYIARPQILKSKQLMKLIALFPQSTVFYIIYGMTVPDVKLKLASFLKCIQIDKQSPISVQLLASLYLRQGNYIDACKLYMKSLQMNMTSPKGYFGLTVSLFAIMTKSLQKNTGNQLELQILIQKCFVRINSYMEYLRITQPSNNYHLLSFLKLVFSDRGIQAKTHQTIFKMKNTLQNSMRVIQHIAKDKVVIKLLDQCTENLRKNNIWKASSIPVFVDRFIQKVTKTNKQTQMQISLLSKFLINNAIKQLRKTMSQGQKIAHNHLLQKHICQALNDACISASLLLKTVTVGKQDSIQFDSEFFDYALQIVRQIEGASIINSSKQKSVNVKQNSQVVTLKRRLKDSLYDYIFYSGRLDQLKGKVQRQVFQQVKTYSYLLRMVQCIERQNQQENNSKVNLKRFQRRVSQAVYKDPSNQFLTKTLVTYLVSKKRRYFKKHRYMSYQVQLLNNLNMADDPQFVEIIDKVKEFTYKKLYCLYRNRKALDSYYEGIISRDQQQGQGDGANQIEDVI